MSINSLDKTIKSELFSWLVRVRVRSCQKWFNYWTNNAVQYVHISAQQRHFFFIDFWRIASLRATNVSVCLSEYNCDFRQMLNSIRNVSHFGRAATTAMRTDMIFCTHKSVVYVCRTVERARVKCGRCWSPPHPLQYVWCCTSLHWRLAGHSCRPTKIAVFLFLFYLATATVRHRTRFCHFPMTVQICSPVIRQWCTQCLLALCCNCMLMHWRVVLVGDGHTPVHHTQEHWCQTHSICPHLHF